jgi:hypothetical protein
VSEHARADQATGQATLAGLAALVLIAAAHVAFALAGPAALLWGDEPAYAMMAREDALAGETSLLPGAQRFEHQPALGPRVVAGLIAPGLGDVEVLRRAGLLQTALFVLVLVVLQRQGRALGLSSWTALLPAALLALCPWFAFHVHSLWPEVLHAFLFAIALLALLADLRRPRLAWLAACGLALGYALLAKGTLQPFVPLVLGFACAARLLGSTALGKRFAHAGLAALVLGGALLAVVGPQLVANMRAGHGARLAANRWWNVELGLTIPASASRDAENPFELEQRRTARYFQAAATPERREAKARERVLEHVAEKGVWSVAAAQVVRLARLVLHGESCLDQSLAHRGRWGDSPPAWLAALRAPARASWYVLLVLGSAGACLAAWRGARERDLARLFLAAFVLLYWVVMLVVPVKVRFLLPLVPVLCLCAGLVADELRRAARRAVPLA